MPVPPQLEQFWAAAEHLHPNLDRNRFLESFAFGSSERMATMLADLVVQGVKGATASLVWSYEYDKKAQPKPGDLSIVTTWAGEPLCIIETTAVEVVAFDDVSEDFAKTEGEDDKTLQSWRRNHSAFFVDECRRIGRSADPRMPVVCERFRVVFQP